jgi:hypothetical protein
MTGHDANLAALPGAARPVFAALATGLDTLSLRLAVPARAGARPGALSRMRMLCARLGSWFEDHGAYFAEVERALPPHERERRRARRDADRLVVIAMLTR